MNNLIIICAKYFIVIPVVVLGVYFLKADKNIKKKIFLLSVISLPLVYIVAKVGSHFYFDPRPFVEGNFIPLISHANDNGFPSDHTLLAAAFASIMYVFNKKLGILLFVVALLIGLSRVVAGVHHIQDILGSIVIAALVTFVVHRMLNKSVQSYKNNVE